MTLSPGTDSATCSQAGPPAIEVAVWHATSSRCDAGMVENYCQQCLDAAEKTRAERFRVAGSRNQHIVGRGMTRHLLGVGGVKPTAIEFAVLPHGKPVVKSPPQISKPFNIAHTDGLVLCGISDHDHPMLGVDVERMDRKTDPQLANRYFSPPEIEYVHSFDDSTQRGRAFLRVWTLKEAFIKAIGTGLYTPLADFAFLNIDASEPSIRMRNPKLESDCAWRFFSFQPRPSYIAAIAVGVEDPKSTVQFALRDFDQFVAASMDTV